MKKVISLCLAAVMCLSLLSMTALAADTPSSWAQADVNKAIAAKLVPQALQVQYTQATTRAEFCALVVAVYEAATDKEITDRTKFNDTTDINVEKAAAIGVVSGTGNNNFSPNAGLTREQAATMLSRLADALGKPLPKQAATFADNNSISSWAVEAVGQIQAAGIMGGVGNNTFAPKNDYTREQSIVTTLRLYDVIKGNTENTSNPTPKTGTLSGTYQWSGNGGDAGIGILTAEFKNDGTVIFIWEQQDFDPRTYTYNGTYKINDNGKLYVQAEVPAYSGELVVDNANDTVTLIAFSTMVLVRVK